MAEESVFDISRKHLVGKMVFTRNAGCRILSVEVPDMRNTYIVDYNDLLNNKLAFYDDEAPVFATDRSLWKGQCLLAAFAPDWDTLDYFVSQIKVNYEDAPEDPQKPQTVLSRTWTDGNTGEATGKTVKSRFVMNSHNAPLLGDQRAFVCNRNGQLSIQIASQWPGNVRDNISSCLGVDKDDVKVTPVHFNVAFDQLVSRPSLIAVAACAGALKTGMDVEFSCPVGSNHPSAVFNITTIHDEAGNILKQTSDVEVDMGYYPIMPDEYAKSITAGLTPVYGLKAIETKVTILKSQNPPANIFGDLGYSMALAACENHYSKLIRSLGAKQGAWRMQKATEGRIQKNVLRSTVFDRIQESLDSCLKDSWFDRQRAVFSQKVFTETHVNPILNYSRGIAVACAQGTEGFSSKFAYIDDYHATGIFTEDKKLQVGMSVADNSIARRAVWVKYLAAKLEIPKESISFLDANDRRVPDMGPDVLGRSVRYVQPLLEDLAGKINQAREDLETTYPIEVTASINPEPDQQDHLFDSDTAGCLVLALHIDPIMMIPVVDHVWARVCYGLVGEGDKDMVISTLKQAISLTIKEICPCADNNYSIDLKTTDNPSKPAGSAQSLMRGLTISCFANALSQALNHDIYKLPVMEEDIIGIINKINGTNKEEAANAAHADN